MNKISVNHPIEVEKKEFTILKNETLEFREENKEVHYLILVEENIHCNLIFLGNKTSIYLEIIQKEGSSVDLSGFLQSSNSRVLIKLNGYGAQIRYAYSTLSLESSTNHLSVIHQAPSTKSEVYCNGFSINHAKIILDVNGYVEKDSSNCSCFQDSKIIELHDSLSQIHPNLYIENYEVEASHAAYMGPFSKQDLFYLQSRGIPRDVATKLLVKALLLGKLNLEESQKSELIQEIEAQPL